MLQMEADCTSSPALRVRVTSQWLEECSGELQRPPAEHHCFCRADSGSESASPRLQLANFVMESGAGMGRVATAAYLGLGRLVG